MIGGKKVTAIIPARAGSKRLKDKNKLPINGIPLVEISVIAASRSKYIDKIIVSTDDLEIFEICQKHNIIVSKRPEHLCGDHATTVDVVLNCAATHNLDADDLIVLLQPTSPLRETSDIDSALEFYRSRAAKSVVSVAETDHSPLWCNILPSDNNMDKFLPSDLQNVRSQDLPQYYRINGAIYITTVMQVKITNEIISGLDSYAFVMEKSHSVDIDNYIDYLLACAIFKNNLKKEI